MSPDDVSGNDDPATERTRTGILKVHLGQGSEVPGARCRIEVTVASAGVRFGPRRAGEVVQLDAARAVALMNRGIVELRSARTGEARRHLEEGLALARRIGASYVEAGCLVHLGFAAVFSSVTEARERWLDAIAIAEANGWASDAIVASGFAALANLEAWQARFDEAGQWLERAEAALGPELESATGLLLQLGRGMLAAADGRSEDALEAFRSADRLRALLLEQPALTVAARGWLAQTLVQLGDTAAARATLAAMPDEEREQGESRVARAALHLAEAEPQAAVDVLAPVLDRSVPAIWITLPQAFLLDASAREAIGDPRAAESSIEHALELAEPDGLVFPFVVTPVRGLLERHPRHRTRHATLLKNILGVLAGSPLAPPAGDPPGKLREELSASELRVLRFLPSNLSAPEIGRELYLSLHTVKTHMRHIYAKLGVHRRTDAVERARELGLLAPTAHRRYAPAFSSPGIRRA